MGSEMCIRDRVHITQAYAIFQNKVKAIQMCTNRFDEDTKNSFVELYTKVDSGASVEDIMEQNRQKDLAQQSDLSDDDDEEADDDASSI